MRKTIVQNEKQPNDNKRKKKAPFINERTS